jgi:tRNA-binding protein
MDVAPLKPVISAEDLAKIDVRVGTIVSVHDVESSRKLVRLAVAFGDRTRDVVAGLKTERADVSALAGRQALFVVNLPPRMMAGVLSEAMLFDIGYADKITPVLAVPEAPVPNGARAG